jgi:uncharacterized protein YcbK (DUF882 family)
MHIVAGASQYAAGLRRMNSIHPSRRELLIATGVCIFFGSPGKAEPSVPRRFKLRNVNTGETFEGPYRDQAGPIPSAVSDLAVFLRDFHVNKAGPIDIGMLDFLAAVMDAVGQSSALILSGYRTPETNAWLRATHFGVAENSQHMYGRAIDVSLDRLEDAKTAARRMALGGVGWYPRSHFIHLDTGPLRNWELDGSGFDLLIARGTESPIRVAEQRHTPRSSAPSVQSAKLPPCRETSVNGVIVTRGSGCAP